jgi:hypothetical protein
MSETGSWRKAVEFSDGLPHGVHASFKHEGKLWHAVPTAKYLAIVGVTDRAIGAMARARTELSQWLSTHPADAERVMMILNVLTTLKEAETTAISEKVKVQTAPCPGCEKMHTISPCYPGCAPG